MEILTTIISISIIIAVINAIYKVFRWIRRLLRKALVKKQPKLDNTYCVLRIGYDGELTHEKFTDEPSARSAYTTAVNFGEYDNRTFIALFERAIIIESNQERSV